MNIYICLENIRSLHNIGALFRTCSFFGFSNVILMGYSAKPKDKNKDDLFHDELIKTSLGSEKDLNIQRINTTEELINFSRENNLKIIAVEQHEESLKLKQMTKDIVDNSIIVFGNETSGISEEILKIADHTIEIEKLGNHNSLNVATTAGIVLYKIAEITS